MNEIIETNNAVYKQANISQFNHKKVKNSCKCIDLNQSKSDKFRCEQSCYIHTVSHVEYQLSYKITSYDVWYMIFIYTNTYNVSRRKNYYDKI